tara:strand:+ start:2012 stop:2188 length:177 start_codon:yes stop_codon:yes gene_type:complete
MLRWLLIGFLIYGMGIGMRDGWIVVKWSQLINEIGFTSVDPEKPMDWSEFLLKQTRKE